VSSVSVGLYHALALTEDVLVYAWGEYEDGALLIDPNVENELTSNPVEALRGVRVGSVAAGSYCRYAVTDTGEL
jgi:alpha-tubulin suppressor-like RCC1 family protein